LNETFAQRCQAEAGSIDERAVFGLQLATDRGDVVVCLFEGNAGLEPAGDAPIVSGARSVRRKNIRAKPDGGAGRKFHFWWQHSDDGKTMIAETKRHAVKIGARAKKTFPKTGADYDGFLARGVLSEHATHHRGCAE